MKKSDCFVLYYFWRISLVFFCISLLYSESSVERSNITIIPDKSIRTVSQQFKNISRTGYDLIIDPPQQVAGDLYNISVTLDNSMDIVGNAILFKSQLPKIFFTPDTLEMDLPSEVIYPIMVDSVNNLWGFATDIIYNPQIIDIIDITAGPLLQEEGVETNLMFSINEEAFDENRVILGISRINMVEPVGVTDEDGGVIVYLHIKSKTYSETYLGLENTGLIAPDGISQYNVSTNNGVVDICGGVCDQVIDVYFDPQILSIEFPGENTIEINIGPVSNFWGFAADISFDPEKIEVLEVINQDVFGNENIPFFYEIDNQNGIITLGTSTIGSTGDIEPGINLEGNNNTIASLRVKTLTFGNSEIQFHDPDNFLGVIAPDGQYTYSTTIESGYIASEPEEQNPMVDIDPDSLNVLYNEVFYIDILVDDVENLFSFGCYLDINPEVLEMVDDEDNSPEEGNFLNSDGVTTYFLYTQEDNVIVIGITRTNNDVPGVSTDEPQVVFSVPFRLISPNNDEIIMNNIVLIAPDGVTNYYDGPENLVTNVQWINSSPEVDNIEVATDEDTPIVIILTGTDVDGDELTYEIVDAPTNGVYADGVYTPAENYFGDDHFTYVANDETVDSESAGVSITITTVDDFPVVSDIPGESILEDSTFATFDLDDYLIEVDGDATIWSYSGNVELTVTIDENSIVTITVPDENWNGSDTLTFTATDDTDAQLKGSDDAVFMVIPVHEPPNPFDLYSPYNGEQNLPTTPEFAWSTVTDNDLNDYAFYNLFISQDSSFIVVVVLIIGLTDTSFLLSEKLSENRQYYWRVDAIDTDSLVTSSDVFTFIVGTLAISDGLQNLPIEYSLFQNYPNPFNPVTQLTYGIPENTEIQIIVYDMAGTQITMLVNTFQTAGYHTISWNASSYPSGVYLIRMVSGEFTQTQKVVLVK